MSLLYPGTNLPAAFNPLTKSPFDVRAVVLTTVDRDALLKTYPGMIVTTIGSANSLGVFADMKVWRLMKDIPTGSFPAIADWLDITNSGGASAVGGKYRGAFQIDTNGVYTPNLADPAIRTSLLVGDYYVVSVTGGVTSTLVPPFDNIVSVQNNDTLWYNGSTFYKYENTNPTVIAPLFNINQTNDFNQSVIGLIRSEGTKQWISKPYVVGEVVFNRYQSNSIYHIDLWYANAAMSQAGSGLPTANTGNTSWWFLGSTNAAMLEGVPVQNDVIGRHAVAQAPTSRTAGVFLSPEEVDARIKEYGGGSGGLGSGAIQGGNAATFLTPDIAALPAN